MPDLSFRVTGVEPPPHSATPLLHFKLAVENADPQEAIQAIMLRCQIRIEPAGAAIQRRREGASCSTCSASPRAGRRRCAACYGRTAMSSCRRSGARSRSTCRRSARST